MDQQNNNPAPERHVPTEAEIARLEAEAAAALQRGDAIPSHAVTPDDAAQAEPQPVAPPVRPDFVPYVDDVPEPACTGTDAGEDAEDDDDDDTYIPSEMEKHIAAMTPEQWKRWQILGGGAVGIAIVICLFAFGQELATYGLIVAALLALLLPRYLERAWRRRLTTARYAMAVAMLAGLAAFALIVGFRTGFRLTK